MSLKISTADDSECSKVNPELATLLRSKKGWEKNLSRREEFFRTVLDSLAEGLLITDDESRIIYANSRLGEVTGYSKDELIGKISYELLLSRDQWPSMRKRLQDRLSGKAETYEHEIIRKDGNTHWIQVRATPYFNGEGKIIGTIGALSCIEEKKTLERENEYLLDEIRSEGEFGDIIGRSHVLCKVIEQIKTVAPTNANVLVLGESGTGKELVARAIHDRSPRKGRPLVRVNCASIPKELFESEFFGHVRGAFTGAIKDRVGRFELADGGTLFLDEIGEIPGELQGKLLRVLQEGQFERVGDDRTRAVNIRLIAATNRDLLAEAKAGRFRQDLYYRLSVFPIELPPLRDRREDIPLLAASFVANAARRLGVPAPKLSHAQIARLEAYDWPGNVRELQNVIERAVILARGGSIQFDLGTPLRAGAPPNQHGMPSAAVGISLHDLKLKEREVIQSALSQTRGKIYGNDGAAELLGLKPTTLASKIKKLGLAKINS